jgi:hypothetical protein
MVLTLLILSRLYSNFFGSTTDFEFGMRQETIISFISIMPMNLRVLDSLIRPMLWVQAKLFAHKNRVALEVISPASHARILSNAQVSCYADDLGRPG